MTRDAPALVRAVCLRPDDDNRRLRYADALAAAGLVRPAEYVRTAVALARLRDEQCPDVVPWPFLRETAQRLRDLWDDWPAPDAVRDWVRAALPHGGWTGWALVAESPRTVLAECGPYAGVAELDRGLVGSVLLPLAAYEAYAPALFAAHPVTACRLTDREPFEYRVEESPHPVWYWTPGRRTTKTSATIPAAFLIALRDDPRRVRGGRADGLYPDSVGFPTADAAHRALSDAAVAVGRTRAGLPPLPAPASLAGAAPE